MKIRPKYPPHWSERIYGEKAAELLLYGRSLGLSHSEAEDVLHETFLAVLRCPETPENPEHYCVRAYRNRARNFHRSLFRRIANELESKRWFELSEKESPEERAAMEELTRLPVDQREVIVLKIWHGFTFSEIASLLNESPNTVAGRYRYGIGKLKISMENKDHEKLAILRIRATLA